MALVKDYFGKFFSSHFAVQHTDGYELLPHAKLVLKWYRGRKSSTFCYYSLGHILDDCNKFAVDSRKTVIAIYSQQGVSTYSGIQWTYIEDCYNR